MHTTMSFAGHPPDTLGPLMAMECIAYAKDPKILCNRIVIYFLDICGAAFLSILLVLIFGQQILQHIDDHPHAQKTELNRIGIFARRVFVAAIEINTIELEPLV